jgi:hypothetical protein
MSRAGSVPGMNSAAPNNNEICQAVCIEPRFSAKLRFDPYFQTPLDSIYASVPTKVADVPLMVPPFHIELR